MMIETSIEKKQKIMLNEVAFSVGRLDHKHLYIETHGNN